MFEKNDEEYLVRAISQNKVVLFLGAGFSAEALNKLGRPLPIGSTLGELMWVWLGYDGQYDGTALPDMYEAILASGRKESEIEEFLNQHLLCDQIPAHYDPLTGPFWYRIYTTNVDDLVERVYTRNSGQRLDVLRFPIEEPRERDQSLATIQVVHLHGQLPCRPNEITFSVRQYARRAVTHDPLYDQFVRDYVTRPTVFVGTTLNEPLLWQYIEARAMRSHDMAEHRPKSFLITRRVSPPKKSQLRAFNVVPVESSAAEFLEWIRKIAAKLPNRVETLEKIAPDLAAVAASTDLTEFDRRARTQFFTFFHSVPVERSRASRRSVYLLGASPQWEDLLAELDAPRSITSEIQESVGVALDRESKITVFALLGSAGCGKSTVLRRLGINLARSGRLVYLTNSEEIPKPADMCRAIDSLPTRAVLLFDNAEVSLALLPSLVDALGKAEKPPIIVIASRTNDFDRRVGRFSADATIKEYHVPNMNRKEIEAVISVLDHNNLLGRLQGMTQQERVDEFEVRASKQILIAMREATSGEGFDNILKDEFKKLEPREAKILYLCVALATEAGYRITKQEYVGCTEAPPADALNILERNLRDIIVASGNDDELLMLRHRAIAQYAVEDFTPRPLLREAYVRLLSVLATEVIGMHWRSRTFGFYRDLVNHLNIYKRFEENVEEARAIYDALASQFKRDAQFWLQYGSLELEAGQLQYAENYLNQAESLDPGNVYIQNAKAHLMLKEAVAAETRAEAIRLRDQGSAILLDNIHRGDINDPYCYHIYGIQRHSWMHRWVTDDRERVRELEQLRKIIFEGVSNFSRNRQLRELKDIIEREYLSFAVTNKE